jgi:hypothetical protein
MQNSLGKSLETLSFLKGNSESIGWRDSRRRPIEKDQAGDSYKD